MPEKDKLCEAIQLLKENPGESSITTTCTHGVKSKDAVWKV
jgi:hypothetical protein